MSGIRISAELRRKGNLLVTESKKEEDSAEAPHIHILHVFLVCCSACSVRCTECSSGYRLQDYSQNIQQHYLADLCSWRVRTGLLMSQTYFCCKCFASLSRRLCLKLSLSVNDMITFVLRCLSCFVWGNPRLLLSCTPYQLMLCTCKDAHMVKVQLTH